MMNKLYSLAYIVFICLNIARLSSLG